MANRLSFFNHSDRNRGLLAVSQQDEKRGNGYLSAFFCWIKTVNNQFLKYQ
jgi:hypothetical protein